MGSLSGSLKTQDSQGDSFGFGCFKDCPGLANLQISQINTNQIHLLNDKIEYQGNVKI